MKIRRRTCKECIYYNPHKSDPDYGYCQYNPPRVIGWSDTPGDTGPYTRFPEVRHNQWCGALIPREDAVYRGNGGLFEIPEEDDPIVHKIAEITEPE